MMRLSSIVLFVAILTCFSVGLASDAGAETHVIIGLTKDGDIFCGHKKVSLETLSSILRSAKSENDSMQYTVKAQSMVHVTTLQNVLETLAQNNIKHVQMDTVEGLPWSTMLKLDMQFDKATYQVGDTVEMTVTINNNSGQAVSGKKLLLDIQCLTLNLTKGDMDKAGTWTRLHGTWTPGPPPGPPGQAPVFTYQEASFDSVDIANGESASYTIRFPALTTGMWHWSADYAGLLQTEEILHSQTHSYSVSSKDGAEKAVIEISTVHGKIYIELYVEECPGTAMNFASSVVDGKYNGVLFHRIIKGFMIQGGDPEGTGEGSFGYSIPFETPFTLHTPGVISMARNSYDLDTAGSQFFIMHKANQALNGLYCAFGMTLQGQDVVEKLANVSVSKPAHRPLKDQKIENAKIVIWPLRK